MNERQDCTTDGKETLGWNIEGGAFEDYDKGFSLSKKDIKEGIIFIIVLALTLSLVFVTK